MSYGYKTSLKLDGVSHDVNVVSYAFDKSINETGKATSPAQGGKIFLSLADMPKKNILKWGIESRSTTAFKSGIIETIGIDTGSPIAEEEIAFEYAACVNLKLLYERDRSNYFTTLLTISAKKMCIGRSNCWVNKENWVIENDGAEHNSNILDEIKESVSKDAVIEGFLYVMGKKYEIQAYEEQMLIEYMLNSPNREASPYSDFAKKAVLKAAKFGGGYAMSKTGTFLTKTADRYSLLSKHYESGHRATMRVQKSFRGKKAQHEAIMKLITKSEKYGKSATQKAAAGTALKKLASKSTKGALRPISIFDAFKVYDAKTPTTKETIRAMSEFDVLSELKIYCERNNNYLSFINQQYFDNAD